MAMDSLSKIIDRSMRLRQAYHQLEIAQNGNEWNIESDVLAYLTDAGLVGRNVMSQQGTWPKTNSRNELEHKLGENIWWLIVIANRSGIDVKSAIENFLEKTEKLLDQRRD